MDDKSAEAGASVVQDVQSAPNKQDNKSKFSAADIFKFVGLLAFLAISALICRALWPYIGTIFEEGGLQTVIDDVRAAGPLGVLVLEGLQFLQIVVAFIPGEVVQIAAGMIYGPWLGALVILVGCVFTSFVIFQLVHRLGAPFVQDMVPMKYMDKFRQFEQSGKLDKVVFILFLIPGMPKDTFTYLVPLTDMECKKFLLLANVGRIPGIVLSTFAADALATGDYLRAGIVFGVTAIIAVAAILCKDKLMVMFGRIRNKD